MSRQVLSTAERLRRARRDQHVYRRRSLHRRSQARFRDDLRVLPHLFLAPGQILWAELLRPTEVVISALRGRAVWTLDTAARLVCGRGLFTTRDLTGYLDEPALLRAVDQGLVGDPRTGAGSVDPLLPRPALLIAHLTTESPPFLETPGGDRVVTWEFLQRDLLGTLGWRPDLLARLEGRYVP